ncbi:hypothetical protein ACFVKC_22300 [Streptomyces noursei]|uniref:hypothetical protein n=1 Tax=Streptomyces noursei TaxID=1971 RepID=UPI003644F3A9
MAIVTQQRVGNGTASDFTGEIDWSIDTVPDPVTVSPASGSVELADIILVGSRSIPGEIQVSQIDVDIDHGNEAWHLALDLGGIQASNNLGWTHTVSGNRITFKPTSGHAVIDNERGITLQVNKLRISRKVGTGAVIIGTKWRANESSGWRTDEAVKAVGKFPPGFYLDNFKADPLIIENGDSVTLTWDRSSGATQTLLYENAEIDVTDYTKFEVKNLSRNTMFYLRSRVQQGTDYAERVLNTYVTVNQPDLEIRNLTVHGRVHGNLNADKVTAAVVSELGSLPWQRKNTITATAGYQTTAPTYGFLQCNNKGNGNYQGTVVLEVGTTGVMSRFEVEARQCSTILVKEGDTIKITAVGSVNHETSWYSIGRLAFG